MNYFKSGLLIAMSAIMATNAAYAADVNWLSFRGEGGRGDASAASPPIEFDVTSGKNVAWKQATTGRGIGGPLVINDLVIVTAMTAKINVIFMSKRLIARPASVAGSAVFAAQTSLHASDQRQCIAHAGQRRPASLRSLQFLRFGLLKRRWLSSVDARLSAGSSQDRKRHQHEQFTGPGGWRAVRTTREPR